ncbi:hypothetical protein PR003_g26901 [Phytophthora rubi]|uniref:Uncharacterized protein n=2 Tax=Phytophthora rubi TaxID=129364 RepID=A0A6A4C3P7_9STRA|nr:hypothetical protein PR003_g26901 [Phytophthora rubi]
MSLPPFKVKPSSSTKRPEQKRSGLASAYRQLKRAWHRGQIGHRSEYSVERLLAFRDYYKRTSTSRAVAVCVLTPVPAIVVAILIDCIPLRDPAEGWQANYLFWVRMFMDTFVIGAGVAEQVRAVIVAGSITNVGVVVIALASSVTYVLMSIAIAATWHFPIPFGYILLVGPFLTTFWVFTGLVVGPRLIASSPVLRGQLKSQVLIIFTQGIVSMAYPLFTAVFYRLSGIQQTAFVVVMPLIKFTTKQIIANAAQGLHEHMGSIVVFSVDVFNFAQFFTKSTRSHLSKEKDWQWTISEIYQ